MHRTGLFPSFLVSLALATPVRDHVPAAGPVGPLQLGFLFAGYYGADLSGLERRSAWISESDLAVALQIERLTHRRLDDIVTWRREGSSWDAITRRCNLGCEVYFVQLPADLPLPEPYARPYRLWRQQPGVDQRLSDAEVREMVLLHALSDYCSIAPPEVVRLRAAGQSPKAIAAAHPPREAQSNPGGDPDEQHRVKP